MSVDPKDFFRRPSRMLERYSEKRVNPDFYGTIKISDIEVDRLPPPREERIEDLLPETDFSGMKKTPTFMEAGYVYAPYIPIQVTSPRRRGRFPLLSKLRDIEVPPPGTLVRSITGPKQFGIVGERSGKAGVFWGSDGWVDDYEEGELKQMFDSCLEIDSR